MDTEKYFFKARVEYRVSSFEKTMRVSRFMYIGRCRIKMNILYISSTFKKKI